MKWSPPTTFCKSCICMNLRILQKHFQSRRLCRRRILPRGVQLISLARCFVGKPPQHDAQQNLNGGNIENPAGNTPYSSAQGWGEGPFLRVARRDGSCLTPHPCP